MTIITFFYGASAVLVLWLAVLRIFPRLQPARCRRRETVLCGLAVGLLLFGRFGDVPLWNRWFSFHANPSLPMLGMAGAALARLCLGRELLKPRDWRALWLFGAVAGSVLYLTPNLGAAWDPYYLGWERDIAAWVLAALAIVILATGNRLGFLLLLASLAFAGQLLESRNGWDYVVDPFYWLASLGVGVAASVRRVSRALGAGGIKAAVGAPDPA